MSFASMHNDYLDPDRFMESEDYGYDQIMAALKSRSSNRWRWDEIDCSWTGKDADLERCGNQGCKLVSVDEEFCHVMVHAGKTFAGDDVCLNLPKQAENDETVFNAVHELWMEQAGGIVCGCGESGEWDGGSWYMSVSKAIKVPVQTLEDELDAEATAALIVDEAEKSLADWDREIGLADDLLTVLAGWKDGKNLDKLKHCKEGKPGKGSVWAMYLRREAKP